jgi:hypothetical protein
VAGDLFGGDLGDFGDTQLMPLKRLSLVRRNGPTVVISYSSFPFVAKRSVTPLGVDMRIG